MPVFEEGLAVKGKQSPPPFQLQVQASDADPVIVIGEISGKKRPTGGVLRLGTGRVGANAATQGMIIDEKGNVGVGTLENVGAKLDVDGDSRFRGPLTVDQKTRIGPESYSSWRCENR
jgi:hypothetical protein